MRNTSVLRVLLLASLLAAAGGCAARVEPYKCCSNMASAFQQADLVVIGTITAADATAHHPGPEVKTDAFGVLGTDCVADIQVTMRVHSVDKGDLPAVPADAVKQGNPPMSPFTFQYNAPCFHPSKGFELQHPAPALVKGDKVKVYLVWRGQTLWMIAHELKNFELTNDAAENIPPP